ncbi:MAG: hypothetical protein IH899_09945 [Planctomycetes bacterium]|nr:hypothetical protein [Planctomycetota bacterium]
MSKSKRRQLYVDGHVQGAIIRRVAIYWACCVLFVVIPLCIGNAFRRPDLLFYEQFGNLWNQYWPILVCMVCMLPFSLLDALQLSNRFAGPMFRLRRQMHLLAEGKQVEPLMFREGDFYHEMALDLNRILERYKNATESRSGDQTLFNIEQQEETLPIVSGAQN